MDKLERIQRVLAVDKVDRPPISLWYHFGVQHGPGERFARIALEFFESWTYPGSIRAMIDTARSVASDQI